METLARLSITHRRTAYHHPEGNSYIERFHRSLKEEEVWVHEYRSGRGAHVDRKMDHRVQSRSPALESAKSNAAPGVLSLASYTTFRGPKVQI